MQHRAATRTATHRQWNVIISRHLFDCRYTLPLQSFDRAYKQAVDAISSQFRLDARQIYQLEWSRDYTATGWCQQARFITHARIEFPPLPRWALRRMRRHAPVGFTNFRDVSAFSFQRIYTCTFTFYRHLYEECTTNSCRLGIVSSLFWRRDVTVIERIVLG